MLKGVNDSDADARELVRLLRRHARQGEPDPVQSVAGRALRVQLQQPHPTASPRSSKTAASAPPVRTPRGRDILAACGQLKTASERARRPAPVAA